LDGNAFSADFQPAPIIGFLSALDVMKASPKTKCKFEGVLLYHDPETREVEVSDYSRSPQKRKYGEEQKTTKDVIDVVLSDTRGPVYVTLWDSTARSFLDAVVKFQTENSGGATRACIVSFDRLEVTTYAKNKWNGSTLTPMRSLQSVQATGGDKGMAASSVSLVQEASSPYLQDATFQLPPQEIYIQAFANASSKLMAPFRASFRGVVADLKEVDYTVTGDLKREFKLVDKSGAFILCCALRQNARAVALVNNAEVLLYFATGRGELKNTPGMVYAMKDAVIMPLGKQFLPPAPKMHIPIGHAAA
jgi:hypothetical protein